MKSKRNAAKKILKKAIRRIASLGVRNLGTRRVKR